MLMMSGLWRFFGAGTLVAKGKIDRGSMSLVKLNLKQR